MRYYPAAYDRPGVEQWIARNREGYQTDGVGLWVMLWLSWMSDILFFIFAFVTRSYFLHERKPGESERQQT
jgi:hypothetical protein